MSFSNENTAAHHLHTILRQVRDSGGNTYSAGWAHALAAEWSSPEFARRHTEVVTLLQLTLRHLNALPERSRLRSERYINDWWVAVMQPVANWSDTNRPSQSIISQEILDHLESTAELISGNLVGSDAAPRSGDLDEIANQCKEWVELLRSMSETEISGPVRDALISQIEHLIWLIDHVELFGGARVAGEASSVIGSLTQASATLTSVQPETASRWRAGVLALLAACVFFNQAAPIIQESIDTGTDVIKGISAVVDNARGNE
ncbi:hypothetical protein ACFYPC_14175 [Streptomyces sp. NPDC005808]|uniref:hypothetical protein n=1 Tax=Streptomyces sp. NPDC005808 TaxID=3364734 RepID=UPI0036CAAC39